jgi:DNA (cytosine-5)-methyltransferase 1
MNVLDLFSGIGGFSLGLERAGMRTVAFCEIDPFCRAVLAKHWPDVPCHDDIRTLRTDGLGVDVICGGFPCQDLSIAQGKARAGLEGKRSGLWSEYARVIGDIRPQYVIVENVTGLLSLGVGDVLGDLAAIGYDAEWQVIPAGTVGAPHIRDRWWLVGYPHNQGQSVGALNDETSGVPRLVSDTDSGDRYWRLRDVQMGRRPVACQIADNGFRAGTEWSIEPDVGRVAHGVPARVDRLRALGNAIVPQIAEIIGRAIMNIERGDQ